MRQLEILKQPRLMVQANGFELSLKLKNGQDWKFLFMTISVHQHPAS